MYALNAENSQALHEQFDLLLEFTHTGEGVAPDGALCDQR